MTDSPVAVNQAAAIGPESDNSATTSVTVEVETHPVSTTTTAPGIETSVNLNNPETVPTPTPISQQRPDLGARLPVPPNLLLQYTSAPYGTAPILTSSADYHLTTPISASRVSAAGEEEETAGQTGPSHPSPGSRRHSSSSSSVPGTEQAPNPDMNEGSADNVHSRSNSSRRQRNGLFGINIDLNFDPSWLVPSNVAGRSISSLSMLPEWARPPVNISIPNREAPTSVASDSRVGQPHHHHHHASSGSIGGSGNTASRLVTHTSVPSTSSGSWNSSFASSAHASASAPNIQHSHHHHHHHHHVSRARHNVSSMRSVDEDLDADYNPVSAIDLGAGRARESRSYVIDMDSPMGGWGEDDGVSTQRGSVQGSGSNGANNAPDASGTGGNQPENNDAVERARRTLSDMGLPIDGNAPSMADAATAANERTRAAEILRDAPETRAFINEISRYTTIRPFLVINFLKGVFDHGTSILAFLALVVTFSHANSMVKKEVSKQRKRNLLYLSMIVINLIACVAFIYYIFSEMELYYALIFLPAASDLSSFWSLMWAVGVTDYIAKFGTVLVKICVVALPGCVLPFQKRGKYYLFIEHSSQLYRSFLPVYPWMFYLVSAYEGTARMFGLSLAGLYVFFKITDSVGRIKEWLKALEKLLSNVHYGTSPTTKQLDSAGTICPICHDNYSSPTRLSCSHIFCEECVATWFDRERTCPMCRAKVVDDPTYRDGSTSQYIQLF